MGAHGQSDSAPQKPRIVIVTRKTPLQQLIARHGTPGQAKFYLRSRAVRSEPASPAKAATTAPNDEAIAYYESIHRRFEAGLARVVSAVPVDQRRTRVDRDSLDRFLFAPDDIVVVVGQDGLVANVAKYLHGQVVIGINPSPESYDGVLCPHAPEAMPGLLKWVEAGTPATFRFQNRAMALAERETASDCGR